jgi:hypothetical protein
MRLNRPALKKGDKDASCSVNLDQLAINTVRTPR